MNNLPFGFERPEDSPGFLLWQTTMIWQRQIKKALEPYGISHAQFVILACLMWFEAHGHETTQALVSAVTQLDKMTVSKSLKYLTLHRHVHRAQHKSDTRAKSVTLTEQGKILMRILVRLVEGIDNTFFGQASESEQEQLIRILRELI